MEEIWVRLVVAGGIAVVAATAAILARRGRAWRRRTFHPIDLQPGVHLFTSDGCSSCARARSELEGAGLPFVEHTHEEESGLLRSNGVSSVPTVAWVPAEGGAGWVAEGVPTVRTLVRWMGP